MHTIGVELAIASLIESHPPVLSILSHLLVAESAIEEATLYDK
jgi:hypothetical protein